MTATTNTLYTVEQLAAMGKEALRAACRENGVSYGKLNNDGMRAALIALAAPALFAATAAVTTEDTEDDEVAPVVGNPFGALLGTVSAPAPAASGTKVVDGKKVEAKPEAAPAAPKAPRVEKTPAPFVPKVERKGYKVEKDRPVQNGVKRPSVGTVCEAVWSAFDALVESGIGVRAADLPALADEQGWNRTNVSCEYYAWRKFNGIKGRQA